MKVYTMEEITSLTARLWWPELVGTETEVARGVCVRHDCFVTSGSNAAQIPLGSGPIEEMDADLATLMSQVTNAKIWIEKLPSATHVLRFVESYVNRTIAAGGTP